MVPARHLPLSVSVIAACALLAGGVARVAEAAFPGRNGKIAHTDDCSGWGVPRIGLMNPDGTQRGLLRMGGRPCRDWSEAPDQVLEASGPSWAPDGRTLLFEYGVVGGDTLEFAVAEPDGAPRRLVPLAPSPTFEFRRGGGSFGPDGRRFVYVRTLSGRRDPEIWIASTDGTLDRRLGRGALPRWSPDGRTIAYVAGNPLEQRARGTWLMDARTGRVLRRVWRHSPDSLDWSPDGRRLLAAFRSGGGLHILRADGGAARRFSSPSRRTRARLGRAVDAVWSPDGRRIAFVRLTFTRESPGDEFDHRWEIWNLGADGTSPRRLWHRDEGFDSDAPEPLPLSWQPRPR